MLNKLPNTLHIFEDLDKEKIVSRKNNRNKNLRKRISRVSWRNMVGEIDYRAVTDSVDPYLTSRTCSRCEYVNKDLRGQVSRCRRCGLIINQAEKRLNKHIPQKKELPHSHEWWKRTVKPLLNHEL